MLVKVMSAVTSMTSPSAADVKYDSRLAKSEAAKVAILRFTRDMLNDEMAAGSISLRREIPLSSNCRKSTIVRLVPPLSFRIEPFAAVTLAEGLAVVVHRPQRLKSKSNGLSEKVDVRKSNLWCELFTKQCSLVQK